MVKAAIYCRVSTEEQARNGISLQCQKEALTKYANKMNYKIIDYYIDDGYTGTNLKRPGLQRLLNDVKNNMIDIVLLTKLDRWGRGVKNYYKVDEILTKYKVHWKTILEDYDTTTSSGKLHINIMLSIGENESATTSERIKFVFKEKIKKKEPVSFAKLPLGYIVKDKKYIIDPLKATIVKDCFNTFLLQQSIRMTRIIINNKYSLNFTDKRIKAILTRKLYIGVYEGSGLIVNDFCEPIIDVDTFNKAQEVINMNVKTYVSNNNIVRDYIFTGIITCKECNKKLSSRISSNKNKDPNKTSSLYICSCYKSSGKCSNNHSISEKEVERQLLNKLKDNLISLDTKVIEITNDNNDNKIDTKKINSQIESLLNLYLDKQITKQIYTKKYTYLLSLLKEANKEKNLINNDINKLFNLSIPEKYYLLDNKEKRVFWRSLISNINYNKDKTLEFNFIK